MPVVKASPRTVEALYSSFISVSPQAGVLGPRQTVRIQVDFLPEVRKESYKRLLRLAGRDGKETLSGDQEELTIANEDSKLEKKESEGAPSLPVNSEDSNDPDEVVKSILDDTVSFSNHAVAMMLRECSSEGTAKRKSQTTREADSSARGEETDGQIAAHKQEDTRTDFEEKDEENKHGETSDGTKKLNSNPDQNMPNENSGTSDDSSSSNGEPFSRLAYSLMPLFAAPQQQVLDARSSSTDVSSIIPQKYYLAIKTTVVDPALAAKPRCLRFGQVVCGDRMVRALELKNTTPWHIDLKVRPLAAASPFSVLNALRTVGPHKTGTLLVEFVPSVKRRFAEILTLEASDTKLRIGLVGQGLTPRLQITHDTSHLGYLHAGDILCGESSEKTIKVRNDSNFPFHYCLKKTEPPEHPSEKGYSGLAEFNLVPKSGTIKPGETTEFMCKFQADRGSNNYQCIIRIGRYTIPIRGRCHNNQLFHVMPPEPRKVAPPMDVEALVNPDVPDAADMPPRLYEFLQEVRKAGNKTKSQSMPVTIILEPKVTEIL